MNNKKGVSDVKADEKKEEGKIKHKRRNFFVSHKFQTNFILQECLPVLFVNIILGGVIYFLSKRLACNIM